MRKHRPIQFLMRGNSEDLAALEALRESRESVGLTRTAAVWRAIHAYPHDRQMIEELTRQVRELESTMAQWRAVAERLRTTRAAYAEAGEAMVALLDGYERAHPPYLSKHVEEGCEGAYVDGFAPLTTPAAQEEVACDEQAEAWEAYFEEEIREQEAIASEIEGFFLDDYAAHLEESLRQQARAAGEDDYLIE